MHNNKITVLQQEGEKASLHDTAVLAMNSKISPLLESASWSMML